MQRSKAHMAALTFSSTASKPARDQLDRATLRHFAFSETGGATFSSAVKFLVKNSMNLFRLSIVASRRYANVCPLYFLVGCG